MPKTFLHWQIPFIKLAITPLVAIFLVIWCPTCCRLTNSAVKMTQAKIPVFDIQMWVTNRRSNTYDLSNQTRILDVGPVSKMTRVPRSPSVEYHFRGPFGRSREGPVNESFGNCNYTRTATTLINSNNKFHSNTLNKHPPYPHDGLNLSSSRPDLSHQDDNIYTYSATCRISADQTPVENDLPNLFQSIHYEIQRNLVQLDLSENTVFEISGQPFLQMRRLGKLSFRNNSIYFIEPGSFEGLTNLVKMDLSYNELYILNRSMFTHLPKLQRLNLAGNPFFTTDAGTFDALPSLKWINLPNIKCDCKLKWIVDWIARNHIKMPEKVTCGWPQNLMTKKIKYMKKKEFHCNWKLEVVQFDLEPTEDQLVFEGDTLILRCKLTDKLTFVSPRLLDYYRQYRNLAQSLPNSSVHMLATTANLTVQIIQKILKRYLNSIYKIDWVYEGQIVASVQSNHNNTMKGNPVTEIFGSAFDGALMLRESMQSVITSLPSTSLLNHKFALPLMMVRLESTLSIKHIGNTISNGSSTANDYEPSGLWGCTARKNIEYNALLNAMKFNVEFTVNQAEDNSNNKAKNFIHLEPTNVPNFTVKFTNPGQYVNSSQAFSPTFSSFMKDSRKRLFYDWRNISKTTHLDFISDFTRHCPQDAFRDPKGLFIWSTSLRHTRAKLVCPHGKLHVETNPANVIKISGLATRYCHKNGTWGSPNTSECQYENVLTRDLYALYRSNLKQAIFRGQIFRKFHHLFPLVLNDYFGLTNQSHPTHNKIIQDSFAEYNLIFLVNILEKILEYLIITRSERIVFLMLRTADSLMNFPPKLIYKAQIEGNFSTKILFIMDRLTSMLTTRESFIHASNYVYQTFVINRNTFKGLICLSYISTHNKTPKNLFGDKIPNTTNFKQITQTFNKLRMSFMTAPTTNTFRCLATGHYPKTTATTIDGDNDDFSEFLLENGKKIQVAFYIPAATSTTLLDSKANFNRHPRHKPISAFQGIYLQHLKSPTKSRNNDSSQMAASTLSLLIFRNSKLFQHLKPGLSNANAKHTNNEAKVWSVPIALQSKINAKKRSSPGGDSNREDRFNSFRPIVTSPVVNLRIGAHDQTNVGYMIAFKCLGPTLYDQPIIWNPQGKENHNEWRNGCTLVKYIDKFCVIKCHKLQNHVALLQDATLLLYKKYYARLNAIPLIDHPRPQNPTDQKGGVSSHNFLASPGSAIDDSHLINHERSSEPKRFAKQFWDQLGSGNANFPTHVDGAKSYVIIKKRMSSHAYGDSSSSVHASPLVLPWYMYVGGCLLFLCFVILCVLYITLHGCIIINRALRHCLLNEWIGCSILLFIYLFGLRFLSDGRLEAKYPEFMTPRYNFYLNEGGYSATLPTLCRAMGFLIHYFTLCVLFWVTLVSRSIYDGIKRQYRIDIRKFEKDVNYNTSHRDSASCVQAAALHISFTTNHSTTSFRGHPEQMPGKGEEHIIGASDHPCSQNHRRALPYPCTTNEENNHACRYKHNDYALLQNDRQKRQRPNSFHPSIVDLHHKNSLHTTSTISPPDVVTGQRPEILSLPQYEETISFLRHEDRSGSTSFENMRSRSAQWSQQEVQQKSYYTTVSIFGIYLFGYGVSLLICGITAAISLENYYYHPSHESTGFCFLTREVSIWALYTPFCILMVVNGFFVVRSICMFRKNLKILPQSQMRHHRCITNNQNLYLSNNEVINIYPPATAVSRCPEHCPPQPTSNAYSRNEVKPSVPGFPGPSSNPLFYRNLANPHISHKQPVNCENGVLHSGTFGDAAINNANEGSIFEDIVDVNITPNAAKGGPDSPQINCDETSHLIAKKHLTHHDSIDNEQPKNLLAGKHSRRASYGKSFDHKNTHRQIHDCHRSLIPYVYKRQTKAIKYVQVIKKVRRKGSTYLTTKYKNPPPYQNSCRYNNHSPDVSCKHRKGLNLNLHHDHCQKMPAYRSGPKHRGYNCYHNAELGKRINYQRCHCCANYNPSSRNEVWDKYDTSAANFKYKTYNRSYKFSNTNNGFYYPGINNLHGKCISGHNNCVSSTAHRQKYRILARKRHHAFFGEAKRTVNGEPWNIGAEEVHHWLERDEEMEKFVEHIVATHPNSCAIKPTPNSRNYRPSLSGDPVSIPENLDKMPYVENENSYNNDSCPHDPLWVPSHSQENSREFGNAPHCNHNRCHHRIVTQQREPCHMGSLLDRSLISVDSPSATGDKLFKDATRQNVGTCRALRAVKHSVDSCKSVPNLIKFHVLTVVAFAILWHMAGLYINQAGKNAFGDATSFAKIEKSYIVLDNVNGAQHVQLYVSTLNAATNYMLDEAQDGTKNTQVLSAISLNHDNDHGPNAMKLLTANLFHHLRYDDDIVIRISFDGYAGDALKLEPYHVKYFLDYYASHVQSSLEESLGHDTHQGQSSSQRFYRTGNPGAMSLSLTNQSSSLASYVFISVSIVLGITLLFYHALSRNDILNHLRYTWKDFSGIKKGTLCNKRYEGYKSKLGAKSLVSIHTNQQPTNLAVTNNENANDSSSPLSKENKFPVASLEGECAPQIIRYQILPGQSSNKQNIQLSHREISASKCFPSSRSLRLVNSKGDKAGARGQSVMMRNNKISRPKPYSTNIPLVNLREQAGSAIENNITPQTVTETCDPASNTIKDGFWTTTWNEDKPASN